MADRHPLGRRCGDPRMLLAVVLLMPYALTRYAIDARRERCGRASRPKPTEPEHGCDPDYQDDEVERWCGAARELGGQQPCPIKEPCSPGTCRIGDEGGADHD